MSIVTAAEARTYSKIPAAPAVTDATIEQLIDEAEEFVAAICGCKFAETEMDETLDGRVYSLRPTVLPLVDVTSLSDAQPDAVIGTSVYRVLKHGIRRDDGDRWARGYDRYELEYTGGYGDTYAIPAREPHGAENRGETIVRGVDVFSPPRTNPSWQE